MTEFEPVVGLEVHAEVATRSKMFCTCSADFFGAPPNSRVCPVCLGLPGTLPVINREAVAATLSAALAFHCEIPEYAKFDRKNYTYPDLMKGYQISQYDLPLSQRGWVEIGAGGQARRVGIRRVHLEEDTAKLFHVGEASLIDVNRSGVPLMEIVSEPDLHSTEDIRQYSLTLWQTLRYLGVSSGDMEKGALRFEANISLRPRGATELSKTRVEIKNLNSIRAMLRAVEYEIARQEQVLRAGGVVTQETMGWDDARGITYSQRGKEEAHDYRYFPEPDLPRLEISREWVEELRAALPELPEAKRDRYVRELGLSSYDAGVLAADKGTAGYFEAAVEAGRARGVEAKQIANYLTSDLFGLMREAGAEIESIAVAPVRLAELLELANNKSISTTQAKTVLGEMFHTGRGAGEIVAERGMAQVSDRAAIEPLVERVLAANPGPVEQYRAGKTGILKFLVGQVMRESRGQANPTLVNELLAEKLG